MKSILHWVNCGLIPTTIVAAPGLRRPPSGIGANTAFISLINTLTLWTLPVRNPVNL